jgi:MFS transporter, NNP family, nitrate/nitrite transporter
VDYFDGFKQLDAVQSVKMAGLFASMFGLMHLFARTLGGYVSDRTAASWGLSGRVKWLFIALFCEGLALMLFSEVRVFALAVPTLLLFGLFMKMSEGATYAVVPFINSRALGSVAGIVGAGGNAGAVAAGLLFNGRILWPTAFFILGAAVTLTAFLSFAVTFDEQTERELRRQPSEGVAADGELASAGATA